MARLFQRNWLVESYGKIEYIHVGCSGDYPMLSLMDETVLIIIVLLSNL